MVVQSGLVKAALVFSTTLSLTLLTAALPAFAQVSSGEASVNEASTNETSAEALDAASTEMMIEADNDSFEEQIVSEEESEAAVLEIAEIIMLDAHEVGSAEVDATEVDALASLPETKAPEVVTLPGASALDGLTSASLDLSTLTVESVPALKTALDSDNDLTQLYAADALWTLTGDSELVLPTLMSAAASDNLSTRQLATAAIAHLGRRALPAIPLLDQLISNSDSRTRNIAQDALSIITSSNRPETTLGIIRREVRRSILIPAAVRAVNYLWR